MESGFDSAGGQGGKSSVNVSGSLTSFQQLQDLPNHNSGTFKNRFAVADLGINNDFSKTTFGSHKIIIPGLSKMSKEVYASGLPAYL